MEKTAGGLVAWSKKFVGNPYWYGTFCQKPTMGLLSQKRNQYPNHYRSNRMSKYRSDVAQNKEVMDCVGLIQGYMWYNGKRVVYNRDTDVSANGMIARATVKGNIDSMPDRPGICVHFNGHIGVYIGDGRVIEARGFSFGVQNTELKQRPWKSWLECPFICYDEEAEDNPLTLKVNGKEIDVELMIEDGRTYVKLAGDDKSYWIQVRALAGLLGSNISWDGDTRTVELNMTQYLY